ncbi:MAG: pyridoxamine 5'-phosphate oxidase family protein [Dermatophilaceae bacterium]|jgi:nitroimidazol reductase NimA-like FMN-containing flavoprotein (pyridoxamine 5'-phosphate oxidase superfamily)|nr:pyridoxamine 5'-phosphate oxidase family protein [Actinomycetales bacterium]MBP8881976.1 pyridoxamine 5'-phosphate oxidase family protein [Dermatophilaceae bacterium]MBP9918316.1 pyridoxamine 5'-phosphate oxidase family protein [Dermatophilaceae bacterium]
MSDDFRIEQMSTQECWEVLDRERFGRLAVAVQGEPDIFPINFLVDNGTLLMRTAAGTKLTELVINAAVAVEADGRDGDEAWSVIVKGLARMVDSFSETYADDEKHLETWLPSDKPIYVEITVRDISGRRFYRGSAV